MRITFAVLASLVAACGQECSPDSERCVSGQLETCAVVEESCAQTNPATGLPLAKKLPEYRYAWCSWSWQGAGACR